ncbi:hypothetical protein FKM82_019504 [Ascaphus truei]
MYRPAFTNFERHFLISCSNLFIDRVTCSAISRRSWPNLKDSAEKKTREYLQTESRSPTCPHRAALLWERRTSTAGGAMQGVQPR